MATAAERNLENLLERIATALEDLRANGTDSDRELVDLVENLVNLLVPRRPAPPQRKSPLAAALDDLEDALRDAHNRLAPRPPTATTTRGHLTIVRDEERDAT